MKTRRTALIGACATALLLTGPAEAQFQGFGLNEDGYYDRDPYDSRSRSDAQRLEDAINPYGSNPYEQQRLHDQLERGMRAAERYGCDQLVGNPAAQQRCYERLY